jgi:hypothetical protein
MKSDTFRDIGRLRLRMNRTAIVAERSVSELFAAGQPVHLNHEIIESRRLVRTPPATAGLVSPAPRRPRPEAARERCGQDLSHITWTWNGGPGIGAEIDNRLFPPPLGDDRLHQLDLEALGQALVPVERRHVGQDEIPQHAVHGRGTIANGGQPNLAHHRQPSRRAGHDAHK